MILRWNKYLEKLVVQRAIDEKKYLLANIHGDVNKCYAKFRTIYKLINFEKNTSRLSDNTDSTNS